MLKDGFKKFLKADACNFPNCRFNLVCNHIHCVRENCNYVLHSSGQMLSHKRKHERLDSEDAYRRFKQAQKAAMAAGGMNSESLSPMLNEQLLKTINNNPGVSISPEVTLTVPFSEASNSSVEKEMSAGFLQQQQELLKAQRVLSTFKPIQKPPSIPDHIENLEDGIPKSVIQNSSFFERATSVEEVENTIRQYFSDYCTRQVNTGTDKVLPSTSGEQNEPLNLKNEGQIPKRIECFMTGVDPHFHCLIQGCEAVLPKSLNDISEHIKMHELSRIGSEVSQASGASSNLQQITSIEGFFNRKRGRPPKNRVVEVYNNSQLPPQAIFTSFKLEKSDAKTSNGQHNLNNNNGPEPSVTLMKASQGPSLDRVRIVQPADKCPDPSCIYDQMLHFHCNFTRACHFMTNYSSSMEAHLEDLHGNIKILDGFMYFDRNYDCRYPGCGHNKVSSHFHCVKCDYGFSNSPEMDSHICRLIVKKEPELNLSRRSLESAEEEERKQVVRAAGTYFPENSDPENITPTKESTTCDKPFCKLKKKVHYHCDLCNQAFTDAAKLDVHYLRHQSSKLGDFMDTERRRLEENSVELVPIPKASSSTETSHDKPQDLSKPSPSQTLPSFPMPPDFPHDFSLQSFHLAQLALQYPFYYQNPFMAGQFPSLPLPPPLDQPSTSMKNPTGLPTLIPSHFGFPNPLELSKVPPELLGPAMAELQMKNMMKRKSETEQAYELTNRMKLMKTATGAAKPNNVKMFKDEPIPTGYLKFRFNEDCNFPNCGYRNHQSHFHCCRQDCFYSFCDKTRFVQHTARHERLDKLMGDDFKQYRANMRCGHEDCAYNKNIGPNNKSSHFHCLKCEFICSDTNKVVAHRRQHSKMEYINAAGFKKMANNEKCESVGPDQEECPYSMKQTHYHCLHCDKVFISRAQLSAHRHPGINQS